MIDAATKELITNSAYYHLKHYEDFGGNNTQLWINKINNVIQEADNSLINIIQSQEKRELDILRTIFDGEIPTLEELVQIGIQENSAAKFIQNFIIGKNEGNNIEIRIEALNNIIGYPLISNAANEKPLEKAMAVITKSFNQNSALGKEEFKDLDSEYMFISTLVSVAKALKAEISKEPILKDVLNASLRKLNGAIDFYIQDYKNKVIKYQKGIDKLDKILKDFSFLLKESGKKTWGKKHAKDKSFDAVSTVIKRSADGFLKSQGGKNYEKIAAETLLEGVSDIFKNSQVVISDKKAEVTGLNKDALTKRQQKGDITLTFFLNSTDSSPISFNLSFSVKKKESGDFIQIHHGGSLFAYANRLSNSGLPVDFTFLNEGNFQYVYVNELAKNKGQFNGGNEFLSTFKEMITSFGWVFLGQKVSENVDGADFLYIQGKIYAFSTILNKIRLDPSTYLQTIVEQTKKDVLTQKHTLLTKYPLGEKYTLYNEDFIRESINIGKNAVYGTTFSIYLKKIR